MKAVMFQQVGYCWRHDPANLLLGHVGFSGRSACQRTTPGAPPLSGSSEGRNAIQQVSGTIWPFAAMSMSRVATSSDECSDISSSWSTCADHVTTSSPWSPSPYDFDALGNSGEGPPVPSVAPPGKTVGKAKAKAKANAKAKETKKAKAKAKDTEKAKAKAKTTTKAKAKSVRKVHLKPAAATMASSGDEALPGPSRPTKPQLLEGQVPRSSGVSDYIHWAISQVLQDEQRQQLSKRVLVGSMCAGMGMEEIVLTFLGQALLRHNVHFEAVASFKAEKDPTKLAFLKRHYKAMAYFNDNMRLAEVPTLNSQGVPVKRPVVDLLLCGIVCKDISQLNNKPKSERDDGVSGGSLNGLLAYINSLPLELRPKLVLLECVQRLGQSRAVDPDSRTGTEYISDELSKAGYVRPSVKFVGLACSHSAPVLLVHFKPCNPPHALAASGG